MKPEVFVDTSAWLAVSDRRDKYHRPASLEYRRLIEERSMLVTTNLVIAETYILIRRIAGHAPAMRFLGSLRGSPRLHTICSDDVVETMAIEILESYTDQDFSFTDAVGFAVMQMRGIEHAFTFDNHFATMGFRIIPDLIRATSLEVSY
ncbi:MAG: type II toxin-antitoxin system VapC family toxin [Anaerolineales bacterium]